MGSIEEAGTSEVGVVLVIDFFVLIFCAKSEEPQGGAVRMTPGCFDYSGFVFLGDFLKD